MRQGRVEGPLCFILLYALSATHAQLKRPQHQRVIAVDSRAETTTWLDLSDLCFVDDVVGLLFLICERANSPGLQKWCHKCFSLGVFV